MISWKLWKALLKPPAGHPLFGRTAAFQGISLAHFGPRNNPVYSYLVIALVLLAILMRMPSLFSFLLLLIFIAPASLLFLLFIAPIAFPIAISILGAVWAAHISYTIAREHERGVYDLLCLIPEGALGANWAIACGCIHRGNLFEIANFLARIILYTGLFFLAILLLIALAVLAYSPADMLKQNAADVVHTVGGVVVLLIAYCIHYVQTMVLVPIIGMLLPTMTRNRTEAQIGALGLFLTIQFGSYALFLLAGYFTLPLLSAKLHLLSWAIEPRVPVVCLVLLYICREAILSRLLRVVTRRLSADPSEKTLLMLPE
jgi:hypothetical protein